MCCYSSALRDATGGGGGAARRRFSLSRITAVAVTTRFQIWQDRPFDQYEKGSLIANASRRPSTVRPHTRDRIGRPRERALKLVIISPNELAPEPFAIITLMTCRLRVTRGASRRFEVHNAPFTRVRPAMPPIPFAAGHRGFPRFDLTRRFDDRFLPFLFSWKKSKGEGVKYVQKT